MLVFSKAAHTMYGTVYTIGSLFSVFVYSAYGRVLRTCETAGCVVAIRTVVEGVRDDILHGFREYPKNAVELTLRELRRPG